MTDTHAHIDTDAFDEDRQEVLQRAFDAGVEFIIIPAIEPKGYGKLLDVARLDKRLFCSMGIHPHNATEADENIYKLIEDNARDEKVVAIGEIGLDYYYDFAPQEVQREVFRRQVQIAKELDLPVIVHNREADEDVLNILGDEQDGSLKGVLHCFSSPVTVMQRAVDLGFHVSFTGNITFKKTDLGEVVRQAPMESIMIETDSPYMTPVPYRGRRNEPALVEFVAKKIAEYKSISIEEVLKMTTKTARELFRISLFLLAFALSVITVSAQDDDEEAQDENALPKEEVKVHPYNKFIGLGFYAGSNTIVDTYYTERSPGGEDITEEGILAFGGGLFYQALDYMIVEAAYVYSKDTKIAKRWEIAPNVYNMVELAAHWTPNPYSRINVFATTGVTFLFNSIAGKQFNRFGLNTGVGFYGNIPVKGAGLFNLSLEWRLTFVLGRRSVSYTYFDGSHQVTNPSVPNTQFYSIPRVGLIFYPDFLGR